MKKKIESFLIVACLYIFAVATICAQEANNKLVLKILLTNGTTVNCDFDSQPKMTFGKNTITLMAQGVEAKEWEFTTVQSWSFEKSTAIRLISVDQLPYIEVDGNRIIAYAQPQTLLTLFDINGRQIERHVIGHDGEISVSLKSLTKGVYIVNVGTTSLKFMIR